MNYNEDPDDDGQAIRDQRLEDRMDREEAEARLNEAMHRHPAGSQR